MNQSGAQHNQDPPTQQCLQQFSEGLGFGRQWFDDWVSLGGWGDGAFLKLGE
jgi:hypothetical protein